MGVLYLLFLFLLGCLDKRMLSRFWAKKQAVGKSDHLLISIYIFTNPFSYSFCKLIRIPVFAWNHVSPPWK